MFIPQNIFYKYTAFIFFDRLSFFSTHLTVIENKIYVPRLLILNIDINILLNNRKKKKDAIKLYFRLSCKRKQWPSNCLPRFVVFGHYNTLYNNDNLTPSEN
jgi:hypothetical protein